MIDIIENPKKANKENFIAWVMMNKGKIKKWIADNPDGLPEGVLKSNNTVKIVVSVIQYLDDLNLLSGEGTNLIDECLGIEMDKLLA